MSRELIFYPAFRDASTGKVKTLLSNVEGEPTHIFWRSQSFIELDWFIHNLTMLKEDEFDDNCKDRFTHRFDDMLNDNDNHPTYVYLLTEEQLNRVGESYGIINGYVPLEDLKAYYQSEYPQEYLYWQMPNPLPPEVFLELPDDEKKEYGKLYAVDTYSKEYVCSVLAEAIDHIYVPWDWQGERCVLVLYSC